MLEEINFSDKDELYILGDIVDRGPDAFSVFDYIVSHDNVYLIMGNHEKMMMDFIRSVNYNVAYSKGLTYGPNARYQYQLWMNNGGGITYDQLLEKSEEEQQKIIETFDNLPFYKTVEVNGQKFLLCHARPVFNKYMTFEENLEYLEHEEEILWCRSTVPQHIPKNYIVIHGHSPVQYLFDDDKIVKYSYGEIIDIDCGCAGAYKLACLRLDDMQEFYVDCE